MMKGLTAYSTAVSVAIIQFCVGVDAQNYGSWYGQRGVQVKGTIALEGGILKWENRTIISQIGGVYLTLDLKQPFNTSTDDAVVFQSGRSSGTTNSDIPNYMNGHMFQNGQSWYTFAGEPQIHLPSNFVNSVGRGDLYGPNPGTFSSGGGRQPVDNVSGIHENIALAAYASSQDTGQGLGWTFGGMTKTDWSVLLYPVLSNETLLARPFFYQVQMGAQQATFTPLEAPTQLQAAPRAQGGLVWLPFGEKGILVALGGVAVPGDIFLSAPPVTPTNNTFMRDLLIYDIAGNKWYNQSTLENGLRPPGQLAGFCTAVVSSKDTFSQHIIVYGGYDGTARNPAYDDVWILSLPAFQWTYAKATGMNNATAHGRRGSVCFAPNPSTFITVGGSASAAQPLGSSTFVDVLDMSTSTWSWTGTYDPSSNRSFSPPGDLISQLGWPNSSGPGRRVVGNVADSGLNSLMSIVYPTPIATNYPYVTSTTSSTPSGSSTPGHRPKHTNVALIASLATVIPIVVIALIVAIFCIRRRNRRKQGMQRTQNSRSNVSSWIRGTDSIDPHPEKSNASTDDTVVNSPSDYNVTPVIPNIPRKPHDIHQLHGSDTFTPPMHSPGLSSNVAGTHGQAYEIMTHEPRGIMSPASNTAGVSGHQSDVRSEMASDRQPASELPHNRSQEHLSPPSSGIAAGATSPSPISRKPVAERRESTPLPSPTTPNMGHARDTSDVSSAALTASPNTEVRRSQHIQGLPDHPGLGHTSATQGRSSVYKEKFDDDK